VVAVPPRVRPGAHGGRDDRPAHRARIVLFADRSATDTNPGFEGALAPADLRTKDFALRDQETAGSSALRRTRDSR